MSSIINKLKTKMAERRRSKEIQKTAPSAAAPSEPTFSIQPHPAKTNDPADLARGQPGAPAVGPYPEVSPYAGKGPVVPAHDMPPAATRDELRARGAELNNN